jgi:hypothetical protein
VQGLKAELLALQHRAEKENLNTKLNTELNAVW